MKTYPKTISYLIFLSYLLSSLLPLLSDVTHIAVVNFTMVFSNLLDRVTSVLLSVFAFLVRRVLTGKLNYGHNRFCHKVGVYKKFLTYWSILKQEGGFIDPC